MIINMTNTSTYYALKLVSKDGRNFTINTSSTEDELHTIVNGATIKIVKRTYETIEHGDEETFSMPVSEGVPA